MTSTPPPPAPTPPDPGLEPCDAACSLSIDLDALVRNWKAAHAASGLAEAAAVVKADGYGLGIGPVARGLSHAGCRTFFVALPEEGMAVRKVAPDAAIFVLNGPAAGSAAWMADADLIPVLNDPSQIAIWAKACAAAGERLKAAVHLDTGMHRLGLSADELASLAANSAVLQAFDLTLVMSHLACGDDPASEMNAVQLRRFEEMRGQLPDAPASLCNSAGIFLGPAYHQDLTRPGICLYGASPFVRAPAPFEPVVTATARILQTRMVPRGSTIGYGATYVARTDMRTATIAAGYADGLFRSLGNKGFAVIGGVRVPYVGRVSMDLVTLDISALDPAGVQTGDMVQIIGPGISLDEVADAAGTIGYEVLTSLGTRYQRRYISGGDVTHMSTALSAPDKE